MKTNTSKLIILLIVLAFYNSYSQCTTWNWPADKKVAEEKVILLQDAMNNKKYRQAIAPLNWILTNLPELNYSIYVHGASLYEALAAKEKDVTKKKKYVDSLMIIYDLRMAICGDKHKVMVRKASAAFSFLINGNEANKVLAIMDTLFFKSPESVSDGLLLPYMQTVVINRQKFKTLTDDDILSRYDLLVKVIEERIKETTKDLKRKAKLAKTRRDIDEWLLKVIKPDCDFVKANLAPRFKQNPTDLPLAKRIFNYMLQGKCIEDPLWLETGKAIFSRENDFGLGKNISLRYLASDKLDSAINYFDKTLEAAPNRKDSSEIYFYKGVIAAKKAEKAKARDFYLKAIDLDHSGKEAYERIGDLYFGSFEECARKEKQADDRAVYLAAYAWYAKAGNSKKMALCKQLFPSREEIFIMNYKKGDHVKIGCWINEEVVLQTRD